MKKIILASASPRRKMLLEQLDIPFEVIESNFDETSCKETSPFYLVKQLSIEKAVDVSKKINDSAIIIAADTVVSLNGAILQKPSDKQDAFNMLKMIQGQMHTVYTGVSIIDKNQDNYVITNFVDNTDVFMRPVSDEDIQLYIETGEPFGKAGAYGIQGKGSLFIEKIAGDYYTVVGLPLVRLYETLKEIGINIMSKNL